MAPTRRQKEQAKSYLRTKLKKPTERQKQSAKWRLQEALNARGKGANFTGLLEGFTVLGGMSRHTDRSK